MSDYPQIAGFINFLCFLGIKGIIKISNILSHDLNRIKNLSVILNNKTFQIYFLVFFSLLIMLGRQLDTGITNFDDAFYAQKAKEIYLSGNLWIVTHGGTPSFENPPLPFWLMALA